MCRSTRAVWRRISEGLFSALDPAVNTCCSYGQLPFFLAKKLSAAPKNTMFLLIFVRRGIYLLSLYMVAKNMSKPSKLHDSKMLREVFGLSFFPHSSCSRYPSWQSQTCHPALLPVRSVGDSQDERKHPLLDLFRWNIRHMTFLRLSALLRAESGVACLYIYLLTLTEVDTRVISIPFDTYD